MYQSFRVKGRNSPAMPVRPIATTSRTFSGVSLWAANTCGTYPRRHRSRLSDTARRGAMQLPRTRTSPAVGRTDPNRHCNSVLLPAPLGPSTTVTWPPSSVKFSTFRMFRPPRCTTSRRISTTGSLMAFPRRGVQFPARPPGCVAPSCRTRGYPRAWESWRTPRPVPGTGRPTHRPTAVLPAGSQ